MPFSTHEYSLVKKKKKIINMIIETDFGFMTVVQKPSILMIITDRMHAAGYSWYVIIDQAVIVSENQ